MASTRARTRARGVAAHLDTSATASSHPSLSSSSLLPSSSSSSSSSSASPASSTPSAAAASSHFSPSAASASGSASLVSHTPSRRSATASSSQSSASASASTSSSHAASQSRTSKRRLSQNEESKEEKEEKEKEEEKEQQAMKKQKKKKQKERCGFTAKQAQECANIVHCIYSYLTLSEMAAAASHANKIWYAAAASMPRRNDEAPEKCSPALLTSPLRHHVTSIWIYEGRGWHYYRRSPLFPLLPQLQHIKKLHLVLELPAYHGQQCEEDARERDPTWSLLLPPAIESLHCILKFDDGEAESLGRRARRMIQAEWKRLFKVIANASELEEVTVTNEFTWVHDIFPSAKTLKPLLSSPSLVSFQFFFRATHKWAGEFDLPLSEDAFTVLNQMRHLCQLRLLDEESGFTAAQLQWMSNGGDFNRRYENELQTSLRMIEVGTCDQVAADCLACFPSLTSIYTSYLAAPKPTFFTHLEHLEHFANFEFSDEVDMQVLASSLATCMKMKHLSLSFWHTPVSHEQMHLMLSKMKHLSSLKLRGCDGLVSLEFLAELPHLHSSLQELLISSCPQIPAAHFHHITQLHSLIELNLTNSLDLDAATVASFQPSSLPSAEINGRHSKKSITNN